VHPDVIDELRIHPSRSPLYASWSAVSRIAAFRQALILLVLKLLMPQRIETVRVGTRSKQRDKRSG
jgi:hypothetical protein